MSNFKPNDLVYGPSENGQLVKLKNKFGGKLLSDVGNVQNFGGDWDDFSRYAMEQARRNGDTIHFDLSNIDDLEGVVNGVSNTEKHTTKEILHLKEHWNSFSGTVKFYFNESEAEAPWIN